MAGSYRHITTSTNEFRGTELIGNLGDAYEALEECYDMIQWLTGGDLQHIHEAWLHGHFDKYCPPENLPLATFDRFWR
jgi:hypothetical protein